MTAVDFYHDRDKEVWERIREDGLPDFVRVARAATEDELHQLQPGEFADPDNRMFPVHSRADTWRSIAYFNRMVEQGIPKKAVAYPATVEVRDKLRKMLSKAAGLWGLEDEEVDKLCQHVTLIKTAAPENPVIKLGETEMELEDTGTICRAAEQLIKNEESPFSDMKATAGVVLKAASTESAELNPDQVRALQRCSGDAACTAGEAYSYFHHLADRLPHYAEALPEVRQTRDLLARTNQDEIIRPSQVNSMVDSARALVDRFGIKNAAPEKTLRTLTLEDVQELLADKEDTVKLAGGVMARKSAVTENSEKLSTLLHNEYGCTDVHTPSEVLGALKELSPTQLIPLRSHIGA